MSVNIIEHKMGERADPWIIGMIGINKINLSAGSEYLESSKMLQSGR